MGRAPLVFADASICIHVQESRTQARANAIDTLSSTATSAEIPILEFSPNPYVLFENSVDKVVGRVRGLNRHTILIFGQWLESAITQTAVYFLLEGFDVFIVSDNCYSRKPAFEAIYLQRLHSIGVTITTLQQVIFELMWQDENEETVEELLKHSEAVAARE